MKKGIIKVLILLLSLTLVFLSWLGIFYLNLGKSEKTHENQDNSKNVVTDVTGLYKIQTKGIIVPHTTEDIRKAVIENDRVSIGGGRYSMGGQTASEKAVQIDMREFNKIISLSTSTKEITVQAGIRWRDIQDAIDPYNLSIKIMQTYSNFTVGGSLSVNVHGRYIGLGPVIMSVKKIQVVLADGRIVEATPDVNKEIFYSTIGGMGGIGVITEVTLGLSDNVNVERERVKMPITEYKKYFFDNIRQSSTTVFHNGDIYPMDFDTVSAVSWKVTDKVPTTDSRLIPRKRDYWFERAAWVIMSEWIFGKQIREYVFEPLIYRSEVVHTRNYEASYDVAELEPNDRNKSTYVLQEYFIPVERFDEFYPKMKKVFVDNNVNVLNVSIRHAQADPGALLSWAKQEVFAFVVYYKQKNDSDSKDEVARWTRDIIDRVIEVGGSYYLPYQPHATELQLIRSYPNIIEFFEFKKKIDPTNKFTNNLWDKYYDPQDIERLKELKKAELIASTTMEYIRSSDNMFLSIPEWYIVYSAGEYANVLRDTMPSNFDYLYAIKEYWREYIKVNTLTYGTDSRNSDYRLVLKIIGISFTVENGVKWIYENSLGRFTEWLSGNKQVEEDKFAAKIAREYELFIYDYPWYDFPYSKAYHDLSKIPVDSDNTTFSERLRKLERQIFLRIEYGLKYLYATVIRIATHAKFGVQDDILHAVIFDNDKYELISAPHYNPFTIELLKRLDAAHKSKSKFEVIEIAGNNEITISYLDELGADQMSVGQEIMRSTEITEIKNGSTKRISRISLRLSVSDIDEFYNEIINRGAKISHFYDY